MSDHLIQLTEKECHEMLLQCKGEKVEIVSSTLQPLSEIPAGFLGNHYVLTFNILTIEGKEEAVRFFVKKMPNIKVHAKYVDEIGVFKKEVQLFMGLLPELQECTSFLKLPWSPKCYLSKNEFLIHDDLSVKKYKLARGRGLFDLEHCIAVLTTLAEFHTSSIIWENNRKKLTPEKYRINEVHPEVIEEVAYVTKEGHTRTKWLSSGINALKYLCKKIGRKDSRQPLEDIIRKAVANMGASAKWPNVLSHGDLWANNFMFLYDEDENVEHCSMVDFQLARYAPCAVDLMCCIHLIASQRIRKKHLSNLINVYYERLGCVLKEKGIVIKDLMTRDQLKESCLHYKQTALAEACLFGTSIYLPAELSGDVLASPSGCLELTIGDRSLIVEDAFRNDNFFRVQITELINELIDSEANNYL